MNASELFLHVSPDLAHEIIEFLHTQDKASYKSTLGTLAAQRKLRPVFLEKKPKKERHAWMQQILTRPMNLNIATNLMQLWLIQGRTQMLCDFLDSLNIPHDGKGGIDDLPPSPDKELLRKSIQDLMDRYPKEEVLIYMHLFQDMDIAGWDPLRELLETEFYFDKTAGK